jgi:hypothetical protein
MFRALLAHPQSSYTAWSDVVYAKCVAVWFDIWIPNHMTTQPHICHKLWLTMKYKNS